jgi:gluconokinase
MPGCSGPLIIALDFGTSSVRAVLFDDRAEMVEGMEVHTEYTIAIRAGGAVEVNADLLLNAAWKCLDDILARLKEKSEAIAGVAVCTFVTSILGLDDHWRPVTPLVLYSDTRSEPWIASLRQKLDEEAYHQRCGVRFHTLYWPARLLWWAADRSEEFHQIQHWMSLGDYLNLRLFGEPVASYSSASWTGMLNLASLDWDGDILAALPVTPGSLPQLTDIDHPLKGLRPEFAARWPSLKNVPWIPAIGDGAAANLGSGCLSPEKVAVTVGTTSAVRVVLPGWVPQIPKGLWCYLIDQKRPLLGGAMTEGGSLFAWINQLIHWPSDTDFDAVLESVHPDGHGLTFLPLLGGERNPGWAAGARGAISGLSFATSPADILRAGLESVAYRISLIYGELRCLLPVQHEIVASGKAILQSPHWLQILADVLGKPVRPSKAVETSARGTARLALEVLGLKNEIGPDTTDMVYQPDEENFAVYEKARLRQQSLYQKLVIDRL